MKGSPTTTVPQHDCNLPRYVGLQRSNSRVRMHACVHTCCHVQTFLPLASFSQTMACWAAVELPMHAIMHACIERAMGERAVPMGSSAHMCVHVAVVLVWTSLMFWRRCGGASQPPGRAKAA
eukprot:363506-Chlamydomonas_euryale.AAC.13